MEIVVYHFLLLGGLMIACMGVGHALRAIALRQFPVLGYDQWLFSGLVGAVALAAATALWHTHGVTIFGLTLPMAAFFWYELRCSTQVLPAGEELSPPLPPPIRGRVVALWPGLVGGVFVYAFCAWGFVRPGAYVPYNIPDPQATFHHDHVYSSRIAYFSQLSGQESDVFLLNLLDPAYRGTKPYHYLELWLTNTVAGVTGHRQVAILYLVVYPFFYWLGLVGILAVWSAGRTLAPGWLLVGSIAFLFVGGFTFEFYKSVRFLSLLSVYKHPLISGLPKLGQVYVFLLAGLLLVWRGRWIEGLLTLLMLGTTYLVVFPGVALAAGAATVGAWLFRIVPRPQAIRGMIYASFFGLSVAAFYHFFDVSTVGREGASTREIAGLLQGVVDPETLRLRFNIIVGGLLQVGIVYAPYLLLIVVFWPQWWVQVGLPSRVSLIFAFILLSAGTVAWAVFYKQLNSLQLFYNLGIPLANVLLIALAGWLIRQPITWRSWFAGLIFSLSSLLLFWDSLYVYPLKFYPPVYSDAYLERIDTYLHTQLGTWLAGASLRAETAFPNIFEKYVTIYTNGSYLPYLGNGGAVAISLNDGEIPLSTDPLVREREKQAIGMGLFYRWLAREKAAGTYRDLPTSQLAFIQHFKLRFLILSAGVAVPPNLQPLLESRFVDPLSGEQFVIFRPVKQ